MRIRGAFSAALFCVPGLVWSPAPVVARMLASPIPSKSLSAADYQRALTRAFATCSVKYFNGDARLAVRGYFADEASALSAMQRAAPAECVPLDGSSPKRIKPSVNGWTIVETAFQRGHFYDEYYNLDLPPDAWRGDVYSILYQRSFAGSQPALRAKPLDYSLDVAGSRDQRALQYVGGRLLASCIVRADYADSRALILSKIGSNQEEAAFKALGAQIGGCIPDGRQVSLNKAILSGLIAEVLYRESVEASAKVKKEAVE